MGLVICGNKNTTIVMKKSGSNMLLWKNLAEGQHDVNLPSWKFWLKAGVIVYKDLGGWLDSVDFKEGAFTIFPDKWVWNVPLVNHDWKSASSKEDIISMLQIVFLPDLTGNAGFITEIGYFGKLKKTQVIKYYLLL